MHYVFQLLAGVLLANGVPHFVQGMSGAPFQSPFAKPPGIGESSPVVNVVWGFANLAGGLALLAHFVPIDAIGWIAFGGGALLIGVFCASHFGKVRAKGQA